MTTSKKNNSFSGGRQPTHYYHSLSYHLISIIIIIISSSFSIISFFLLIIYSIIFITCFAQFQHVHACSNLRWEGILQLARRHSDCIETMRLVRFISDDGKIYLGEENKEFGCIARVVEGSIYNVSNIISSVPVLAKLIKH